MRERSFANNMQDRIFDIVLEGAMESYAEKELEEIPSEEELKKQMQFSKGFEKKINKLFEKERRKQTYKTFLHYSKRIAVMIAIIFTVTTIVVFNVEAFRVKILNFIIEMQETHTDIKVEDKQKQDSSLDFEDINFGYVPEGFKCIENIKDEDILFIKFSNNHDQEIILQCSPISAKVSIDTENAYSEKVRINGNDGLLVEKGKDNSLVWHDKNNIFRIFSNLPTEEIIKIAEKIIKK